MTEGKKVRIAAVSDIHVKETSRGHYQELFAEISKVADVMVLAGDLTDRGLPTEAKVLRDELKACTIPKLAVLGNHDHESDQAYEVVKTLREAGVVHLEEEAFQFDGVGFAGVKGFAGGFGQHMLAAFGEPAIKSYVKEALDETQKLEVVLGELVDARQKVIVMHYSPIVDTNKGEPIEIYPFLGSSRFEEVMNRYDVAICFHGHAHHGSPHGKTAKGADVYNVAYPLMQKIQPEKPYRLVEI